MRLPVFNGPTPTAVHTQGEHMSDPQSLTAVTVPEATVRTQVDVPLSFADGYATTARVFTFAGLVDGREHLALGLGDWEPSLDLDGPVPLVRPHSECLTGDVFGSQ